MTLMLKRGVYMIASGSIKIGNIVLKIKSIVLFCGNTYSLNSVVYIYMYTYMYMYIYIWYIYIYVYDIHFNQQMCF